MIIILRPGTFIDIKDGNWWDLRVAASILWKSGRGGRREVMDHANVSRNNRHKCRECFCCACREVWKYHGEILDDAEPVVRMRADLEADLEADLAAKRNR